MLVRLAQKTDKPAINELRRQVKLFHTEGNPVFFAPGFPRELADYLDIIFAQDNAEVVVAELDGQVVGFACITYVERPGSVFRNPLQYCDIDELGVDERFRRQGIGRAMFDFIKTRAAERGFPRIELNMWEFNDGALKFYESLGFRTYRRYMEYV